MHAMRLNSAGGPLVWTELPDPRPAEGEIRVRVLACGVCRTDLHVLDGELPEATYPIIPGHEIVGRVDAVGAGVGDLAVGDRVGIPWLGHTCGACPYCRMGRENLCDHPLFTGCSRDGGYATAAVADARFAFPLGEAGADADLAPLLCAGLIGWRSLKIAGEGRALGLYGFGAAAHIIAQVATWQGRSVFAFARPGLERARLAVRRGPLRRDLGRHRGRRAGPHVQRGRQQRGSQHRRRARSAGCSPKRAARAKTSSRLSSRTSPTARATTSATQSTRHS